MVILNKLQNNFAAAFLPAVFGRNNVAEGGLKQAGGRQQPFDGGGIARPNAGTLTSPLQGQLVHLQPPKSNF